MGKTWQLKAEGPVFAQLKQLKAEGPVLAQLKNEGWKIFENEHEIINYSMCKLDETIKNIKSTLLELLLMIYQIGYF